MGTYTIDSRFSLRVSRLAWITVLSLALAAGLSIGGLAHAYGDDWEQQRQQALQNEARQAEQHNAEVQRQWQEQQSAYNRQQEADMQRRQQESQPYSLQTPNGSQYCQRSGTTVYCR